MNIIQKYWKLRKQNNTIKLITVLALIFLILVVCSVSDICQYAGKMNAKTEYRMSCQGNAEQVRMRLQKVQKMSGNVAAAIEKNYTILMGNQESSIQVRELPKAYLAEVYQITDAAFHLNQSAYELQDNNRTRFTSQYQRDGKNASGSFIVDQTLDNNTPFAFKSAGTISACEQDNTTMVSAMFQTADLSGEVVKELQGYGFTIVNQEKMMEQKFEQEKFFITLRYRIFLMLLIMAFIWECVLFYKRNQFGR